jgi:hypothetical protein
MSPANAATFLAACPAPRPVLARPKTPRDYARDVDLAIIAAAGALVNDLVPAGDRAAVARLIANQLHHLSTPTLGWPSLTLPRPDRADWR